MIELRWLIHKVPRPRGIDDGMMQPPPPDFIFVPMLQYREWSTGTVPGMIEPNWIDIPTVEEGGNS